jgi:predicted transport protein
VDAQYSGAKSDLRPIYDAVLKLVNKFGKDVEVAPKKAYVSLRRSKQFAIIQPSTKTRVDVGINCKSAKAGKRLEESGSFNSMVSHRVRLESAADVDSELIAWLREAYNNA